MTFDTKQAAQMGMSTGSDGALLGPGLTEIQKQRQPWLPAAHMKASPIQYLYTPQTRTKQVATATPMQAAQTRSAQEPW